MKYLLCGINAKYIHSNLAIYCLKAYAKKHGSPLAEYIIKEYTINHYVEDILEDIYREGADVLVFSCYIWNISYVRELSAELKKICPGLPVWVGGPEVSYDAEEFLKANPDVDLVMQGEGEEQFSALVALWEEFSGLKGSEAFADWAAARLPGGVVLRKFPGKSQEAAPVFEFDGTAMSETGYDNNGIINTGFAGLVPMDEIPFVYNDFQLFEHKIIYYESSRGCPFNCSYCLSSVDKTVRFRSPELVLPELQLFLDAGVPQVKFVDRTFNCKKSHAMAIWQYIQEHDNGITNFHFEISADLLDEEELELFARMRPGLIQLEIGVQTTYEPAIRAIRRRMDLDKLFFNVDRVHAFGNIHQHLDLIAGLPYENYGQFKQSFNDLYAHAPDQLQLGFLKVLKGTLMEDKRKEYGLVYRSQPPYEVLSTSWLGYDDLLRLKGVEELVETYYNSMQFRWTLQYIIPAFSDPFSFFEAFSEWYRRNDHHKVNHNRLEKYEILRTFIRQSSSGSAKLELSVLDEMLLLDLYLRENVKKRPVWAPDQSAFRQEWKEMYRRQGDRLFPKQWNRGDYDSKKAANASHLEWFSFDVELWMREGSLEIHRSLCLFDYGDRNPLDHNAAISKVL